jgi:lipopolysaccharide biosynthesis regulator YciM
MSNKISIRFNKAIEEFQRVANNSLAAQYVVEELANDTYAEMGRNDAIEALAKAVEARLGSSATLLFRTPGPLHDALQTLFDVYLDKVDGIYYPENE